MTARTHFVYRAFDADGRLLYVGCTRAPKQRRAAHRHESLWFQYADRFTMAGPYHQAEALRRESIAIESELPWFNATHADRGNQIRWRTAHSREWERREPNFELYTLGVGWNHEAMDQLEAECTAAVEQVLGVCPDVNARHAAYLAAVEAGLSARTAA